MVILPDVCSYFVVYCVCNGKQDSCVMYKLAIIALTGFVLAFSGGAEAQTTTIQQFVLGEFIVRKNDTYYQITVWEDGSYTYNTLGLTMLTAPQQGIYDIGGFTPSTPVASVDVSGVSDITNGTSHFEYVLFYESHDATVDGSGYVTVNVGTTIRTSGDGTSYALNSVYSGTIQIQVNF